MLSNTMPNDAHNSNIIQFSINMNKQNSGARAMCIAVNTASH